VVLIGLVFVLAGTVLFTQLGAHTPYAYLVGALILRGVGLGMTMMPAMSAAYQTLDRSAVARATTTLNILNRVGGSIGTALLAVMLQRNITSAFGTGTGVGQATTVPPAVRAQVAPVLADAFGATFWWATAMVLAAFVPALLLPRTRPQRGRVPEPVADAA